MRARLVKGRMLGIEIGRLEDRQDLRDLPYRPALIALPARHFPHALELGTDAARVRVRDQLASDCCTGYALAALIDIQRAELGAPGTPTPEPVSALMLYRMGLGIGQATAARLSLRSAIKGFYHNGVCLERDWSEDDPDPDFTVRRAKRAREVGLGTYYRLGQHLQDYHSAIVEAGAILVSARLHRGWSAEALAEAGRIVPEGGAAGAHAFVVIGYDRDGFYVLNSWGEGWAGQVDGIEAPVAGVAHWCYRDWSERVVDAWVLRLAVPTPDAFEYSIGAQGLDFARLPPRGGDAGGEPVAPGVGAAGEPVATPRQKVLGHYVHIEDGTFVTGGSYPDSRRNLSRTLEYLGGKLRGATDDAGDGDGEREAPVVYLRIAGDTGDADDAMRRIAALRRRLRVRGYYPLSIVWSAALASAFASAIRAGMEQAVQRMPDPSDARDDLIESLLRPIGRPLWRQMRAEALEVGGTDGPLGQILGALNDALDRSVRVRRTGGHHAYDSAIELVVEGTGVLVFVALLDRLGADAAYHFRHVRRIHLAFAIERTERLAAAISRCVRRGDGPARHLLSKLELHRPSDSFLKNSTIGTYTRTWFHLVNNSFDADEVGARTPRIVALDPAPLQRALAIDAAPLRCRIGSREIARRTNTSSMLRWHMVSEGWLDTILPERPRGAKVGVISARHA